MSKFTDLRDKVDDLEDGVDRRLQKMIENPYTARIVILLAIVLAIAGFVLWLA